MIPVVTAQFQAVPRVAISLRMVTGRDGRRGPPVDVPLKVGVA